MSSIKTLIREWSNVPGGGDFYFAFFRTGSNKRSRKFDWCSVVSGMGIENSMILVKIPTYMKNSLINPLRILSILSEILGRRLASHCPEDDRE